MRAGSSLSCAVIVSALLTALYCAGFVLCFRPAYKSGDGPMMALIAAGLHGNPPSELVIFSNVLIGFLLKALYTTVDSINWHGVYLYAVLALSLGGLFFAVLWRGPTLRGVLCCLAIASILLPYWMKLQFTTVAIWATWSAAWLFLGACKAPARIARAMLALGVALLVAGCLIRVHAAIVGLAMMAPWLIDAVRPPPPRRVVAAFLVALSIAGVTTIGDFLYYRTRPEWREWLNYNRARAELHDRPQFQIGQPETLKSLEAVGWSPLDAALFQRWTFFDSELYGTERLHALAEGLTDRFPPLSAVWQNLRARLRAQSAELRIGLPLLLTLCFARRRWAYLARTSASIVLLLALDLWLLHSYKLMNHWVRLTIDVIPIASMVWLAAPLSGRRAGDRWLRVLGAVVLLIYAGQIRTSMRFYVAFSELHARRAEQVRDALTHLTTYSLEAERRGEPVVFVTLDRGIQPEWLNPLQSITVLRDAPILRFGWITHSPHYRAMLERYRLNDVYVDVARRSDVLVVSDPPTAALFLQFLRERRGRSVEADPVPGFPELQRLFGSQVYRLRSSAASSAEDEDDGSFMF
jgi:hypothetical protein